MANTNFCTPKILDQRSKSCETACSSNSSCFLQRRKPINPLASSLRNIVSRSTDNAVRQRVMSAKILKLKSVQNQLNDANFHLAEVMRENQALKNLQKRQDRALSKYEGTNAELPRLLHSHEEDIRILTEKNKVMKRSVKELNAILKTKNEELQSLHEQLKYFEELDKNKHLLERSKLVEELDDSKIKLQKADSEIVLLNRKLTLQDKSFKQKMNSEMFKTKQCQRELAQALTEIANLKILESKDKSHNNGRRGVPQTLRQQTTPFSVTDILASKIMHDSDSITAVNFDSVIQKIDEHAVTKPRKGILKCPSESIKNRLSANLHTDDKTTHDVAKLNIPNSSHKLDKIGFHLQGNFKKVKPKDSDNQFSNHSLNAVENLHIESVIEDTENFVQTIQDVGNLDIKLQTSSQLLPDDADLTDDSLKFVSQLLTEELTFQKKYQGHPDNRQKMEPMVGLTDKNKLLATLRAIDNGDSEDSIEGEDSNNTVIMRSFGKVGD